MKKGEASDPHIAIPPHIFSLNILYPMVLKLFGEESMSYTAGLSGV